jgi:hypothetical protein
MHLLVCVDDYSSVLCHIFPKQYFSCQSRWPRGQRRGSAAARLLGLWVRIPPGEWMSLVSVVCCQVEVSATGRSLVQRSPTKCGVSECDREASIMRRPCPTGGCRAMGKRQHSSSSSSSSGTTTLSWVLACSTVVEHSQQEGFTECRCQRHVRLPTWRRTSDLEHSNFRHKRPPASEATLTNPAAEGGTMGEKCPRILPKVTTSTSLWGSFACRKGRHGTDGFTSPPKEGVLRIFSSEKSDGFGQV